jgi:hypothetical protein
VLFGSTALDRTLWERASESTLMHHYPEPSIARATSVGVSTWCASAPFKLHQSGCCHVHWTLRLGRLRVVTLSSDTLRLTLPL